MPHESIVLQTLNALYGRVFLPVCLYVFCCFTVLSFRASLCYAAFWRNKRIRTTRSSNFF